MQTAHWLVTFFCAGVLLLSSASAKDEPKPEAIRLAIEDLAETCGEEYPGAAEYLKRLDRLESIPEGEERTDALLALRRESLLANPLLDFGKIVLIRRKEKLINPRGVRSRMMPMALGLPLNFNGNSDLPRSGFENQIVVMEDMRQRYDRELRLWRENLVDYNNYEEFGELFDRHVPWEQKAALIPADR